MRVEWRKAGPHGKGTLSQQPKAALSTPELARDEGSLFSQPFLPSLQPRMPACPLAHPPRDLQAGMTPQGTWPCRALPCQGLCSSTFLRLALSDSSASP